MKNSLLPPLIALLLVLLASCEKDDICVDGDTPLLVVGFFDTDDPDEPKTVPSLRITELILNEQINTIPDRASNLDSIGVPLRIDEVATQFAFIANSADDPITGDELGDIDTVTIAYQPEEVFISRACGFVVQFNGLTVSTNTSNWIDSIHVVQPRIENSNAIHVKLFHSLPTTAGTAISRTRPAPTR